MQNAARTSEFEDEPVAVVDGEEISVADFERRVQRLPEYARARYSETSRRRDYLGSLAQFEIMADRAEEAELSDRDSVFEALKAGVARQTLERLARKEGGVEVDQAAVEDYYREHREEFEVPRERRAAIIDADSREEAERLLARIEERLEGEETPDERAVSFRRMAAENGLDPTVSRKGGDIGYVEEPSADPEHRELAEALFELEEVGDVTPVVRIDDRFAVATLLHEREARITPLEEASSKIRGRIEREQREEQRRRIVKGLREEADIDVDEGAARSAKRPGKPGVMRAKDVPLDKVEPFDEDRRASTEKRE